MKREHKLLFLIFLLVLGFRLYFSFQTPNYSGDDAYFNIRHTEYINLHLAPMVNDDLSYGGRTVINSHVFHYFLSFFNAFNTIVAFKIVPELLLALLVIAVYFIAESITKNTTASLLSALASGFIPNFITETLNQVSVYSMVLPLFFYQFYCVINLEKNVTPFIVLSFALPLIHPIGFLFSLMMLVYVFLLEIDYQSPDKLTKEAVLFSLIAGLLISLIIYKKVFLTSGPYAIWQNIPQELLSTYFKNVNVFDIIIKIGIVPLIFGVFGLLFGIYKQKSKITYMLSAMIITDFILLFLRMINFNTGVMFLGILISIVAALGFERLLRYIELTKFVKIKPFVLIILVLAILLTTLLPSFLASNTLLENTLTEQEVSALSWIKKNTAKDSIILADADEGNYILQIAERRNVLDSMFLMAPNRYTDVREIFDTESLVKALQLIDKYNVDYIYFSNRTNMNYDNEALKYINDDCFKERYANELAKVYKVAC